MDTLLQALIYLVVFIIAILSAVLRKEEQLPPEGDTSADTDENIFIEEKPKQTPQPIITKAKIPSSEEKVKQKNEEEEYSVIQQQKLRKELEKIIESKKLTQAESQVWEELAVQKTSSKVELQKYLQLNKEKVLQIVIGNIILGRPKALSIYTNHMKLPYLP
jgi:NhaP-type Na+/H+ and K+/H+ antiporter